jgi:hypothetical protein
MVIKPSLGIPPTTDTSTGEGARQIRGAAWSGAAPPPCGANVGEPVGVSLPV